MEQLDQFLTSRLHGLGWPAESLIELLLAALAGGLVGLEREVRGRQAGFRTNMLVAVGSALVMIVSTRVALADWPAPDQRPGVQIVSDPARIAYSVMTGVGFLGAGIIVQYRGNVRGLTTAAGIWCVAALGLAAGMGLYVVVLFGTLLVVATLWLMDYVEILLPKQHYRDVVVRRRWDAGCVSDTMRRFKDADFKVVDASFKRSDDMQHVDIELRIAGMTRKMIKDVETKFGSDETLELLAIRE
ncbi:MAG TPA: MgtC/SapB family protein [Tepidisphaeraceae bacterium]|nr:MgtC/SapB family protein [Tepidisphaeraceae bacterium]